MCAAGRVCGPVAGVVADGRRIGHLHAARDLLGPLASGVGMMGCPLTRPAASSRVAREQAEDIMRRVAALETQVCVHGEAGRWRLVERVPRACGGVVSDEGTARTTRPARAARLDGPGERRVPVSGLPIIPRAVRRHGA